MRSADGNMRVMNNTGEIAGCAEKLGTEVTAMPISYYSYQVYLMKAKFGHIDTVQLDETVQLNDTRTQE